MIKYSNKLASIFKRLHYKEAKKTVAISVGESVKMMRELQALTQQQLAQLTGISQTTLVAIENNKLNIDLEQAKILAKALACHPAVLVFPGWDVAEQSGILSQQNQRVEIN